MIGSDAYILYHVEQFKLGLAAAKGIPSRGNLLAIESSGKRILVGRGRK